MAQNRILGVNPKNAYNFMRFLEKSGYPDYNVLPKYKLANLFLEYQEDYHKANFSKAKSGEFSISATEMNEPFTLCAAASMAETAEADHDYEAMHCIGSALQAAVEGGANVYRAIALAIRCKEKLEYEEEINEDEEIIDDIERVFNCGSSEGRLRQCEEFSPYHGLMSMLTELATGREKHRQVIANSRKYVSKDAADRAREDIEDMLDQKQAEIRKAIAEFEANKLQDIIKARQEMLVEEQKYMKEQTLADEKFLAENNLEIQGTTLGLEMIDALSLEMLDDQTQDDVADLLDN